MRFLVAFFIVSLFAQPLPAFAALGGDAGASASQVDNARAKASMRLSNYTGYVVREMQEPSGITVREYISPANIVFAVSWQGPSMPNLQQLLGAYADQYARAASEQHAGRRAVAIQSDQLVLRSEGHMRSFIGSAYIPALLPQGVTPGNIH